MTRYVLSPRARRDIDEIWDYTVGVGARTALRSIFDNCGPQSSSLPPIRRLAALVTTFGRAIANSRPAPMFYRTEESGVDIVRIIHARMDVDQHFES